MLKSIARICFIITFLLIGNDVYSQWITDTVQVDYDAYIDQGRPTINFGSDTVGKVGHYTDTTTHYQRHFINFSLDNWPAGTHVAYATLFIPYSGETNTLNSLTAYRVTDSWNEDSITQLNQPGISDYTGDAWVELDTTAKMMIVHFTKLGNCYHDDIYHSFNGIVIEMASEIDTNLALIDLYTTEHSDTTKHPYVTMRYFYPTKLGNIDIQHESYAGAGDGSISFDIIQGVPNYTYEWIDSSGSIISTASNLDSIGSGWYGLYINAGVGGWVWDEFYQVFLVGIENDTVTISMQLDKKHTISNYLSNATDGAGTYWGDVNKPDGWGVIGGNVVSAGAWCNNRILYRPPVWVDPSFNIQSVNLALTGANHKINQWKPNKAQFVLVTEDWWEGGATYNNQPAVDTSNWVLVDSTHVSNQNRTVDVTKYWKFWQENPELNYGLLFKALVEDNSIQIQQYYYPPNQTIVSRRPKLEFKLDLRNYSTAGWESTTETGSIDVDISNITNKTAPYHYFISEKEDLPELGDIYTYLIDSVGISVDSLLFFRGSDTSTTTTFDNLENGLYNLSVFDSDNRKLITQEVNLQPNLEFVQKADSYIDTNNLIYTNSISGTIELNLHTNENLESYLVIDPKVISNGFYAGYKDVTQNSQLITSYQDLSYGIYLSGDTLYSISNGVLSSNSAYTWNKSIELNIEDGVLKYSTGGNEFASAILPGEYMYRAALGLPSNNKIAIKHNLHKPPVKVNIYAGMGTCYGSFGEIQIEFVPFGSSQFSSQVYLYLGAQQISPSPSQINSYSFLNLIPGTYHLIGSYTVGSTTYPVDEYITVLSSINWTQQIETGYYPYDESLRRTDGTPPNLSLGQTDHIVSSVDPNSVYFQLKFNPLPFNYAFINWSNVTHDYSTLNANPIPLENGVLFNRIFGARIVSKVDNGVVYVPPITVLQNYKYAYVYDGSTATLNRFNTSSGAYDITLISHAASSMTHLNAFPGKPGTGFKKMSTDMLCPSPDFYAKVERDLKGVKYKVYLNKVHFYMEEEYVNDPGAAGNLDYNIYSSSDRANPVQSGISQPEIVPNQHGDNRYKLDVTTLAAGVYLLEVQNEKEEKFYLRFIK